MFIREIKIEDAKAFNSLIKDVEANSDYMLMEAGERTSTDDQQRKQIARIQQQNNSTILVAELEGNLAGYLIAIGGSTKKTHHSAYIVIGVAERHRGQGLGSALFQQLEVWAEKSQISRLELTVVTKNQPGIALYKKSGFEIEGTKRSSLMTNGVFYDEYYMSKLL